MTLQPKSQKAESRADKLRVKHSTPSHLHTFTLSHFHTGTSQRGLQPKFRGVPPAAVRAASAFTLIEMITVLTIIIIVLAIAIPVWNALLGGTNLASAQNQISAYLTNARADAIFNRQTIGVCFFIDPKTQQTAVAEVQVQTLWQTHPYPSGSPANATYTSLFVPGRWTSWSSWTTSPYANGPINSIELVNNPDPNNPGNYVFYRDPLILPKGVGVALTNQTYTYNYNLQWNYQTSAGANPNFNNAPLDRYLRIGMIMFNSDGTLAQVPYGIPYWEAFTQQQATNNTPVENLLCQKIGMYTSDLASNYTAPAGSTPTLMPLTTSVGLVVFDHDIYSTQHASMQAMDVSTNTQVTLRRRPVQ